MPLPLKLFIIYYLAHYNKLETTKNYKLIWCINSYFSRNYDSILCGFNISTCSFLARLILRSWAGSQHVPSKFRETFTSLHGVTSQNILPLTATAVRTSNRTKLLCHTNLSVESGTRFNLNPLIIFGGEISFMAFCLNSMVSKKRGKKR